MALNPALIPLIASGVDGLIDLAKEFIGDKDKQSGFVAQLEALRVQLYALELQTQTIPWIDGLHKMGRQILSLVCITATVTLMLLGHEITPTVAAILGGPTITYSIIKGKGEK